MGEREQILNAIRRNLPESTERPELDASFGIRFDDPCRQFAEMLETIGGRCVHVTDNAAAHRELHSVAEWQQASKTVSLVTGIGESNVDLAAVDGPHKLEDVDFAVLPADFGVAENAAVWVTDDGIEHRVIYFLVQHLALVIRTGSIVHNMHQAYERLNLGSRRFGTFISGPSKTADIEQSLVIGAHGARSLLVFRVDSLE